MPRRAAPRTKRLLFLSDTHCGCKGGLTPPPWQIPASRDDLTQHAWHSIQAEAWDAYTGWLKECGPVDIAIHCGDAIDGTSDRSGGTELLTSEMHEQCQIAERCCAVVKTENWEFIYGTPYHTAPGGQDWDAVLTSAFPGAGVHDHAWVECNGAMFDVKHKCGGSSTPTGGDTYLRSEILWSHEWAIRHGWPLATEIVRGHVHRHRQVDHARSLPALQTWTKYGGRQCRGYVDFGLAWADVTPSGEVTWHVRSKTLDSSRPQLLHV